ncbi:MAG: cysteine hydrolase [Rhodoplanes sp.]|uniref:cysteine hydrolase family protein n=1 Tax=Rhodoplanes sp. TaxID=1968906 RepID=UPI0017E69A1F|nr:isochorismatase family cysteine hydrolase [Rhodoplanes sp.]NVO12937.1 cysteine hydrolase [Rhodoplanes sp.]
MPHTAPPKTLRFVRERKPVRIVRFPAAASGETIEIDLGRTAMLVVDMQNDFLHPDGWFPRAGVDTAALRAIVPGLNALGAALRAADVPVLWINWGVRADCANLPATLLHKGRKGGTRPGYAEPSPSGRGDILVQGHWGAATIDELVVAPQDLVVHKHRYSGFHDNELDSVLRARDVTTLLIAGINTDRCVFSTLTDASFRGYDCVLLSDLCATPAAPSVTEVILDLVDLLYGAVSTGAALETALAGAGSSPSPTRQEISR